MRESIPNSRRKNSGVQPIEPPCHYILKKIYFKTMIVKISEESINII